jgi:tripartite-type tricarboxylate transporter receptor subunit TctC
MPVRAACVAAVLALAAADACADEFYRGKRLTILINFAAGGPTDIEGRLFARHLARHVDGTANIVIQNMDGAGGIVGAKYLGEVAPRDGTMAGYFTGTAFMYARSTRNAFALTSKPTSSSRFNQAPPSISCAPTFRPG